jgi:hypothetical protein
LVLILAFGFRLRKSGKRSKGCDGTVQTCTRHKSTTTRGSRSTHTGTGNSARGPGPTYGTLSRRGGTRPAPSRCARRLLQGSVRAAFVAVCMLQAWLQGRRRRSRGRPAGAGTEAGRGAQIKMAGSCVVLAPDGSFVHTDDPDNHDPAYAPLRAALGAALCVSPLVFRRLMCLLR